MKLYSSYFRLPMYWLVQGIITILLVQNVFLRSASAQTRASSLVCQRANLRCNTQTLSQQSIESIQTVKPQVIKFKLNDLAGVAEWIRAEITGDQVKLLHTVMSESGLSRALNRFLPIAISHTWYDHPASRIIFQPDGCDRSDCLITGTDTVMLPAGTDVYQGRFTLEYTESGWLRTITFKLPNQDNAALDKKAQRGS
jgi:hypothetical protein